MSVSPRPGRGRFIVYASARALAEAEAACLGVLENKVRGSDVLQRL
jgi:hypothetical protein